MTNTPVNQAKYKKKMLAGGYGRLTVWVPDNNRDELLGIVKDMRDEHEGVAAKKPNRT